MIGRCPCVLEIRYVDYVTGNLFCSTWRAGLKMLVWLFRIKKLKPWKTLSRSYLQRRKIEKRRQIEFSDNLRMPKLQASWIIATRDSLFYKKLSPLFCFEQVKTLKNFSKKLFTSKTNKIKEEAETNSSVWDLKMPNTLANPRTVKRYETRMCIGLFSNRSQKTSKCGKNITDTLT